MTVQESLQKLGQWSLKLDPGTPRDVLGRIGYFGHIAISTGRTDPRVAKDSLLRSARYVGVVRGISLTDENSAAAPTISGPGMAMWLGDEDKKGSVLENATPFASGSFTSVVRALLPSSGSVTEGTLYSVAGVYTGTHQFQDPRTAIDYVCETFTSSDTDPVGWRVNGDGTLDAGKASQLFTTSPRCAIIRRGAGVDLSMRALRGKAQLAKDVDDFTTRVVLIASGNGASVATGTADIAPGLNTFKDVHGNTVVMTRLVSESATVQGNAAARAQLALNQFTADRRSVRLTTDEVDIKGTAAVGDYVWVHNDAVGLVDPANEVVFRGMRLQPVQLRLIEMTWPIETGMSVAYRDQAGVWTDLTDYVKFESGQTSLTVGGYQRTLTSGGEAVGSRPVADTSIPAAPTFVTPFRQAVYQSGTTGTTKAQVQVEWVKPANTDGTLVLDGDRIEIQYRTGSTPIFPATHSQMSAYTHAQLAAGTHDQPITYTPGPWQSTYTSFDDTSQLIQELTPGIPYDVRVRAYDSSSPPNVGDWSATTTVQTVGDTIAPSTPAPPTVAASRIAVQIIHNLGRSDGGTFNLEPDLNHLEIHAQYTPSYTPDDTTRIGKLLATSGMMLGEIPAVGTFPVEFTDHVYIKVIAVDDAGNKSSPSTAAVSTILLIDDAHISDLTVTKVTAGTISADWLVAATIMAGTAGAGRVQLVPTGLEAYSPTNVKTVDIKTDGTILITGKLQTGVSSVADRVVVDPALITTGGISVPAVAWYDDGDPNNYVRASTLNTNYILGVRSKTDETLRGGNVYFDLPAGGGSAYLGYTTPSTDWYYQIGSDGAHHLKGIFRKTETLGGLGALHVDQVGASGSSMSYSYGPTYASTPLPFVEIQGTSGSPPTASSHALTARSASGFSIQYPAGNCDVLVWAVRYG
jgi:hypothetical protein